LLRPVIQNPSVGYEEILGLERLMEQRLEQKTSVSHRFYPIIICYIDEFSLLVNGRDKEEAKKFATAISRLTRSGRNADIHLIMAIHNPVKDSIGGCDLNAVTARMAFMCSSTHQSVALIGNDDAKTLVRKGEMLFRLSEDELFHLQGANITPQELERVLNHVRSYWERYENNDPIKGQPLDITESINTLHEDKMTASDQIYTQQSPITLDHGFTVSIAKPKLSDKDKMFTEVVIWTLEQETISCRMIERQFKVGYGKASDILERLHKAGIVSEGHGKLPRKVLVDKIEDLSSEITDLLCLAGYATEDVADTSTPKADTNNVTTS
ncbi:MAG: hypothetical protein FWG36_06590, partial [Oscillospiraceae bacterium]|nr:hypothetical protein [Oscillospiraceae bacterium]